MKVTIEKEVCGAKIGKLDEFGEPKFSICDREPHTLSRGGFFGHSSPELRAWRRDQTAKSRAKHRKVKETPAPVVDDEAFYDEPEPLSAFERMLAEVPGTPPKVLAERQAREAQEAALREEDRLRRIEEERFILECLDKHAAGEVFDRPTEAKLIEACVHLLPIHEDLADLFRLDRESRINRGFNRDGIGEGELSEVLYGPSYTGLYESITKLDENSFPVRLGRFLGVVDLHGSRNTPRHPDMQRKATVVTPLPPGA